MTENKINKFIEEHFEKSNFASMSPEEQHIEAVSMAKAIMDKTFVLPLDMLESLLPVGTYLKTSLRIMPDGSYNKKPLDPDYYKKYFDDKLRGVKIECPKCGITVGKGKIARHYSTKICMKGQAERLEKKE